MLGRCDQRAAIPFFQWAEKNGGVDVTGRVAWF
jgi:hypothetical protein